MYGDVEKSVRAAVYTDERSRTVRQADDADLMAHSVQFQNNARWQRQRCRSDTVPPLPTSLEAGREEWHLGLCEAMRLF